MVKSQLPSSQRKLYSTPNPQSSLHKPPQPSSTLLLLPQQALHRDHNPDRRKARSAQHLKDRHISLKVPHDPAPQFRRQQRVHTNAMHRLIQINILILQRRQAPLQPCDKRTRRHVRGLRGGIRLQKLRAEVL